MSVRQLVINKLKDHQIEVSSNQLEDLISKYKDVFKGKFRGIDLLFDILDNISDFEHFVEFIKTTINEIKVCEAEEHFTIITCFARNCQCEKKVTGCSQPQN